MVLPSTVGIPSTLLVAQEETDPKPKRKTKIYRCQYKDFCEISFYLPGTYKYLI